MASTFQSKEPAWAERERSRSSADSGYTLEVGQAGAARQPDRAPARRRAAVPRHRRLRGHASSRRSRTRILSGQDIIFLGERGQAKTRMARAPGEPARRGDAGRGRLRDQRRSARADLPACRALVAEQGDARRDRLAPARPALRREARHARHHHRRPDRRGRPDQGRRGPLPLRRADHPLRPAARAPTAASSRINELPDLAERIQVGLLNIMEERDVQIRGYKVRLPLDLFVVASANPEDYTNRGRIITPLKDRFGSQIRTHYPRTARARDRHHGGRSARRSRPTAYECACRVHEADRGRAHPPRAQVLRHQPALGRDGPRQHLQLREPALQRAQARHPPGRERRWPRG